MAVALRDAGHEVIAVSEIMPAATDEDVAEFARTHNLVILTEDRDFGRLAYALSQGTCGVIYVRWPFAARSGLGSALVSLAERLGQDLAEVFVVMTSGRARIRRLRRE